MDNVITLEDIVKEAENIINNNIEDESKIRKMLGQLLIDDMKSIIDNWDGLIMPRPNCDVVLYEIFECLFEEFVLKELDKYYNHFAEIRNINWGDSLTFSTPNPIKFLNIIDEKNNVHKRDSINGKVTLETNTLCICFNSYFYKFCRNKMSIKKLIDSVIEDIKKYIDEKIKILQDNTQIKDLFDEKPIKIGIANSSALMEVNGYLNLCLKIGIGMFGLE